MNTGKNITPLSEEGLKEIYDAHNAQVYNTALSIVQNASDAEEITQDVFVDVFYNIQEFEGKSALSTWIYRITVNKSLDHIKSGKRKKRFAWLTSLFDPLSGKVIHEQPDFVHPGVKLERQEDSVILFNEINKLPDNQKTAFILSQIEGLSGKEISKIMEVTEAAVESLLVRAKKNLRKWLGDFYADFKS